MLHLYDADCETLIRQSLPVYNFLHFVTQIVRAKRQSIRCYHDQIVIFIHIAKSLYCFILFFQQFYQKQIYR